MATSTLAWGVNTPAHLVVIKGTEYFDAPSRHALNLTGMALLHLNKVLVLRNTTTQKGVGRDTAQQPLIDHVRTAHTRAGHTVDLMMKRCRRYVDFPITDVLQMMGRAGRPQYDRHGVAVIMVHEPKKSFYKKFLYEPFPVESSLHDQVLHPALNMRSSHRRF